jgi:hypothetical protein
MGATTRGGRDGIGLVVVSTVEQRLDAVRAPWQVGALITDVAGAASVSRDQWTDVIVAPASDGAPRGGRTRTRVHQRRHTAVPRPGRVQPELFALVAQTLNASSMCGSLDSRGRMQTG